MERGPQDQPIQIEMFNFSLNIKTNCEVFILNEDRHFVTDMSSNFCVHFFTGWSSHIDDLHHRAAYCVCWNRTDLHRPQES